MVAENSHLILSCFLQPELAGNYQKCYANKELMPIVVMFFAFNVGTSWHTVFLRPNKGKRR